MKYYSNVLTFLKYMQYGLYYIYHLKINVKYITILTMIQIMYSVCVRVRVTQEITHTCVILIQ